MDREYDLSTEGDGTGRKSGHVIGRRSVLQVLTALGGVGAFSCTSIAQEQDEDNQEGQGGDQEDEESELPVGTEELLQYLAAKYGNQLTDEQIAELEDNVAGNVETAQTLDTVDLQNGDDMALTFVPYRGSY